jgi:hypothetical protein
MADPEIPDDDEGRGRPNVASDYLNDQYELNDVANDADYYGTDDE